MQAFIKGGANAALATTVILTAATTAAAQDSASIFGETSASVTYGPYARLEFGGAQSSLDGAYWLPPGGSDPRINFNASGDNTGLGLLAFGYDWQNGFRAEVAVFGTGTGGLTAPCESASDGSSCSLHADISDASVSTRGAMLNLFYAPLEARGSNDRFQPFLVAGLGFAHNDVGDWTRTNPTSDRPVRVFEGDSTSDLAWSVGIGASFQITDPGEWPIILEVSWRHYDFGSASGSSMAVPGNGNSEPRQPFTFDTNYQAFALGVRIPLQRY